MDSGSTSSTASRAPRAAAFLHAALIVAAAVLPYLNSLTTSWHFDDEPIVFRNPEVASLAESASAADILGGLLNTPRFVGYLSFSLNYAVSGTAVFGYHCTNLAVHTLNALIVYALALALQRAFAQEKAGGETGGHDPRSLALLSALIFAVHPVQTQAVTYIVQRFTSLAATFYLLGVLWFLRARESGGSRSALFLSLSFVSGMLAMRTKEIGFTFPFMIFGFALLFTRAKNRRTLLIPYVFLIALNIVSVIGIGRPIEGVAEGLDDQLRAHSTLARSDYLLTQFRVIVTYLRLLLLPVNQNFDYDYPVFSTVEQGQFLVSLLLIALIAGGCAALLLRPAWFGIGSSKAQSIGSRLVAFGFFWFFLGLSVESSVVPILDVINEHRLYLPSVGIVLAVSGGGLLLGGARSPFLVKPRLVSALTACFVILLALGTMSRNRVWADESTFWSDVIAKSPNKARGFYNLGLSYHEEKRLMEAVTFYSMAIERNPRHLKAFMNRGNALDDLGKPDAAIVNYFQAISIDPADPDPYFNLGITYLRMKDTTRSRSYLMQACTMGNNKACAELRRLGWMP